MRTGSVAVLLGALIIGWSSSADAQSPPHKYQITPYFWAAGLRGDLDARDRRVHVDAPFADILDNLDMAGMGAFEARLGRWRILTDILYIDVSGQKAVPQKLPFLDASIGAKTFIYDQEIGYQILKNERTDLDVTGGIRYWHAKNQMQLADARAERLDLEHSAGWVDPIVGLRFTSDLPKNLFVTAKGDIGGFSAGAQLDWEAFGGIGLKFRDHVGVTVGYRNLSVDYKNNGFAFDAGMRGVIVGLDLRF